MQHVCSVRLPPGRQNCCLISSQIKHPRSKPLVDTKGRVQDVVQACLHGREAPAKLGAYSGPAQCSIHPTVLGSAAGGVGVQIRDMTTAPQDALHRRQMQALHILGDSIRLFRLYPATSRLGSSV